MILCGSEIRFWWGRGAGELGDLASGAGFDGVALSAACVRGDVAPVVAAAAAAGLAVPVAAAPLGDAVPPPGKRLPALGASDDVEERRAAIELFDATLDAVVPLGVGLLTVNFGDLALGTPVREVLRHFTRRELDEDDAGGPAWGRALRERRARSPAILDACRDALDHLLRSALRRNVTVAMELPGGPWGAPSPREALTLLDEYHDGPLGIVWDQARMQLLRTLGVAPSDERRDRLAAAARLWRANDAVGVEVGYLPGLGDPDGAALPSESSPPKDIPVVIAGRPDSTPGEVARARGSVAAGVADAVARRRATGSGR